MIVEKAGCILIDIKNEKIGLIFRKEHNDYSFPKGHLEQNETLEECAVRETEEETGRKCLIIPMKEITINEYSSSKGEISRVYYYLAKDMGKSDKTYDESLVHQLVWIPIEEVESKLSYSNLIEIYNKLKPIIIDIVKNKSF